MNENNNIIGETHMPTILGSGEHRYRVVENWAKLPAEWNLTDVASVAVDSKDRSGHDETPAKLSGTFPVGLKLY